MATKKRIGFIGLGMMGGGMASRLAECGYELVVYNRTRAKSEEVAELGPRIAESPGEAATDVDVVMLSLADPNAVSSMLHGEQGVFGSLRQGGVIVDMSTVPPAFARELAETAKQAGYRALDACVYGAPQHARSGELRVMVGGDEADFHEIEDILEAIGGKDVAYLGPNGMGATMKLVLNMLMGVQMPALAEAVVFGERAGLPRDKILQMIAGSGYSSPVMTFRCPMMEQRTFQRALFKLSLMQKDMMLLLTESMQLGVPMPVSEAAYSMLTAAKQQGLGDFDVSAIIAFQERLAGMDDYPWPQPAEDGRPAGRPVGKPAGRPSAPPE
jgi:3-hydroxyisobutyrate dehydrogenase